MGPNPNYNNRPGRLVINLDVGICTREGRIPAIYLRLSWNRRIGLGLLQREISGVTLGALRKVCSLLLDHTSFFEAKFS